MRTSVEGNWLYCSGSVLVKAIRKLWGRFTQRTPAAGGLAVWDFGIFRCYLSISFSNKEETLKVKYREMI